uniref:Uncharacterized protein n=1 Tax=Nelumbo nucifera TaxID=4432 RepID=A0A822Y8P0_NELNU|nr:TPA_asm: hypothetical protein HUJ06_027436 [Nelumbo nucifera]
MKPLACSLLLLPSACCMWNLIGFFWDSIGDISVTPSLS